MKYLLFWLIALPVYCNLYFIMPITAPTEPGAIHMDLGATQSYYSFPARTEDRYYLPDFRIHAQFHKRIALSLEAFGIYHRETYSPPLTDPGHPSYGGGDLNLGAWIDLRRRDTWFTSLKAFFQVKVPNASNSKGLGSDETDVFLGFTSEMRFARSHLSTVARLDIIARPSVSGEQWDFATLGLLYGYKIKPNFGLLAEGWMRYRSINWTALISLGFHYTINERCSLILLAGKGDYHFYLPDRDTRLTRQASLKIRYRLPDKRFKRWLGS